MFAKFIFIVNKLCALKCPAVIWLDLAVENPPPLVEVCYPIFFYLAVEISNLF